MVKYAMPNINRAAAAVKQTVKATGDFAKQQKGNILKMFDAGKNKLKSVGNKVSSGLNSLSGKLNRINDKYIGGKLNKANERIISPKIEKFAVNPFNKFIGSGPGKNATLKEQLAWAGKATVKSIGVGVAKGAISVGGAMAFTAAGGVVTAGSRAVTNLSYRVAARSAMDPLKATMATGAAKGLLQQGLQDLAAKKISHPIDYVESAFVQTGVNLGAYKLTKINPAVSPIPNKVDRGLQLFGNSILKFPFNPQYEAGKAIRQVDPNSTFLEKIVYALY